MDPQNVPWESQFANSAQTFTLKWNFPARFCCSAMRVRSVIGQSWPAGSSHAGLVPLLIGPSDLIALCSGKQQQEDNQVIQSDLMEHTALWPDFNNSNQASALEEIGKYSPAHKLPTLQNGC